MSGQARMDGWCRMGLDDTFLIKQALPFGARFSRWAQFSMKDFVYYVIYIFPREGIALPWCLWIGYMRDNAEKKGEETSRAGRLCSIVVVGMEYLSRCSMQRVWSGYRGVGSFPPFVGIVSSLLLFVVSPLLRVVFFAWFPSSCFSSTFHPSFSSSSSSSSRTSSDPCSSSHSSSSSWSRPSFTSFSLHCFLPPPPPRHLVPLLRILSPSWLFLSLRRHHCVRLPIVTSPSFILLLIDSPAPHRLSCSSSTLLLLIDSPPPHRLSSSSSTLLLLLIDPPPPHWPSCASSSSTLLLPVDSPPGFGSRWALAVACFASPGCAVIVVVAIALFVTVVVVVSLLSLLGAGLFRFRQMG